MQLTIVGCTAAGPGQDGPASGYLIETDRAAILLDCGPGVISALRQSDAYDRIGTVVISHMHVDHCLDLLSYAYARIRDANAARASGEEPRPSPIRVFLPPGGLAIAQALAAPFAAITPGTFERPFEDAFEMAEYDPAGEVEAGDTRIRFVGPLKHTAPNWGVRITADGRTLAYSGDTADCPDLVTLGRDADAFLCEATFITQRAGPTVSHLTAAEAGRAADRSAARRLLLTHLYQQDAAWRSQVTAGAGASYHGPLEVVRAGQTFTI